MSKTNGELQCCNGDVSLKLQSALYNLRRRYNHRQIEDFKKRFNTLIRFKLGFGNKALLLTVGEYSGSHFQ